MKTLNVAILGSGQIGTDLAIKISREGIFQLKVVSGRRNDSPGLLHLRAHSIPTSANGLDAILEIEDLDLVFDCTSARDHKSNWPKFRDAGIAAIDLTPAKIGQFFVPNVSVFEEISATDEEDGALNLNMVTCGGQSASPLAYALAKYSPIKRVELASNIASRSAGPATRSNIDEYIQTTESVLMAVTGADEAKAILILNPAEPPITMQNTLYLTFRDPENVNLIEVNEIIKDAVRKVQVYVPGYRQVTRAAFVENVLTVTIQVKGNGDYLPAYSGNLDIINASAIEAAKTYALSGRAK